MSGTSALPRPASPPETPAQDTGKHTQRFRRAANAVKLDPDQRRRQAATMALGWRVLGSRDALMAFFNTHSDALGGRPLDVAVDSDAGWEKVERSLRDADPAAARDGGDAAGRE